MKHAFYLAFAYLWHHRIKTGVLIFTISLMISMPLMTRMVLSATEELLASRADSTPLVIGAKGSALDVLMNALYFTDNEPGGLTLAASEDVWQSELAISVPVFQRYRASAVPIVATTLDYFDMRRLSLDSGRAFAILGEAVIGSNAAKRLELAVGDKITSDPINLFDLTGSYPLRMPIVGVLAPTGSPDDEALFVDLKTAWVIHGLGHGHDDLLTRPEFVLDEQAGNLLANSGLELFAEITEETASGFHFHGDPDTYPITAVLAFAPDRRSSTILRGRYVYPEMGEQIIVPSDVIDGLLATVFKVGRILDGVIFASILAALIALGTTVYLSLQLRRDEMVTVFKLGGDRTMAFKLVVCELFVMLTVSLVLASLVLLFVSDRMSLLANWFLTNAA